MPNTQSPDDRCTAHRIQLERHGSRLTYLEERVAVHDRTLYGYNGQQDGIVSIVHGLDDERKERRSNSGMIKLTLLAVVLDMLAHFAIAAWR